MQLKREAGRLSHYINTIANTFVTHDNFSELISCIVVVVALLFYVHGRGVVGWCEGAG